MKPSGQMHLVAGDLSDQAMQITGSVQCYGTECWMINCVRDWRLRWPLLLGGRTPTDIRRAKFLMTRKSGARETEKAEYVPSRGRCEGDRRGGSHLRSELDRRSLATMPNS